MKMYIHIKESKRYSWFFDEEYLKKKIILKSSIWYNQDRVTHRLKFSMISLEMIVQTNSGT